MRWYRLLALFALATCATVSGAGAKPSTGVVSVQMPGDLSYRFASGTGVERANRYCLTCHSSAYVSTQPPLDRAHWTAEVTKMRKAYGAEIPEADANAIVDYLVATYGKP